jgi:hypothetical protein
LNTSSWGGPKIPLLDLIQAGQLHQGMSKFGTQHLVSNQFEFSNAVKSIAMESFPYQLVKSTGIGGRERGGGDWAKIAGYTGGAIQLTQQERYTK